MNKMISLFSMVLAFFLFGCQPAEKPDQAEASDQEIVAEHIRDGYFMHISSGYDSPKSALMALSFAHKVKEDHDVILFFDLEGVKLLAKDAEDIQMDHYKPLREALKTLCDAGIDIMACPMCLKAAGLEEMDLMEGVVPAKKEKFFGFTKGRIITLKY